MKRRKLLEHLLKTTMAVCLTAMVSFRSEAQAVGSTFSCNTINKIETGTTKSILSESAYFGPNSDYAINGTLIIYSKNVWIAPTAVFSGTGKIVFYNPSDVGGAASPTLIDGNNGNFIDVNIELQNAGNMVLTDITDPVFGTANPAGALAAALKIGKNFDLAVDNGDVILNTFDFVFDTDAQVLGYRPERKVVTGNSIAGHMVKSGITGLFVFPLGISEADYNPGSVTAASGTIHASLQDRTASTSNETLLSKGIDRTWHIYADADVAGTVNLQHDVATEISGFSSASKHYVTRFLGTSWEANPGAVGAAGTLTTGTSPLATSSMRSLSTTIIGLTSDNRTYFTKAPLIQDLTANLTVVPASFTGSSPINIQLRLRVIEVNDVPTNGGTITARIRTAPIWTIGLTPGSVIGSSGWTYVGISGVNHIFTSNLVLQNSFSQINIPAVFNLSGSTGTYSFSASIAANSGGEENIANNADQESVSYNP